MSSAQEESPRAAVIDSDAAKLLLGRAIEQNSRMSRVPQYLHSDSNFLLVIAKVQRLSFSHFDAETSKLRRTGGILVCIGSTCGLCSETRHSIRSFVYVLRKNLRDANLPVILGQM